MSFRHLSFWLGRGRRRHPVVERGTGRFFKKSPRGPPGRRDPTAGPVAAAEKSSFFQTRPLIFRNPGDRDGAGFKGPPEGGVSERHGKGPRKYGVSIWVLKVQMDRLPLRREMEEEVDL